MGSREWDHAILTRGGSHLTPVKATLEKAISNANVRAKQGNDQNRFSDFENFVEVVIENGRTASP